MFVHALFPLAIFPGAVFPPDLPFGPLIPTGESHGGSGGEFTGWLWHRPQLIPVQPSIEDEAMMAMFGMVIADDN